MKYIKLFEQYILEKFDLQSFLEKEKISSDISELAQYTIDAWYKNNVPSDISKNKDKLILWLARCFKKSVGTKIFDNTDKLFRYINSEFDSTDLITIRDYLTSPVRNTQIYKINYMASFEEMINNAEKWHIDISENTKLAKTEQNPIIMSFDDGYYWCDLETNECKEEGVMMGHCGQTYAATLWSLRKKTINGIESFVTVAVEMEPDDNDDLTIYQAKGKGNKKPISRYHKYIVDMMIFTSCYKYHSEYDADSDFQLADLSFELFKKLVDNAGDNVYYFNSWQLSAEQYSYLLENDYITDKDVNIREMKELVRYKDFLNKLIYIEENEDFLFFNAKKTEIELFSYIIQRSSGLSDIYNTHIKGIDKQSLKDAYKDTGYLRHCRTIELDTIERTKENLKIYNDYFSEYYAETVLDIYNEIKKSFFLNDGKLVLSDKNEVLIPLKEKSYKLFDFYDDTKKLYEFDKDDISTINDECLLLQFYTKPVPWNVIKNGYIHE